MPTGLTRANVEGQCVPLFGRLMTLVGQDGATQSGANASLNGPMRDALTRMGYSLADPLGLTVADADFALLDVRALRRFLEWTELFSLQQVDRDWWMVDTRRPPGFEPRVENSVTVDPLAAVSRKVKSRINELVEIVKTPYMSMNEPVSIGEIEAGSTRDHTRPRSITHILPPGLTSPDGLWYPGWYGFGEISGDYWGLDGGWW